MGSSQINISPIMVQCLRTPTLWQPPHAQHGNHKVLSLCHNEKYILASLVTDGKNLPPPYISYLFTGIAPSFATSIPLQVIYIREMPIVTRVSRVVKACSRKSKTMRKTYSRGGDTRGAGSALAPPPFEDGGRAPLPPILMLSAASFAVR